MSAIHKLEPLPIDRYLAGEQASEVRHEYVDGEVYAMVGGTARHNQLAGRLYAALLAHLQPGRCQPYIADMKVRIDNAFLYPDLAVACGELPPDALYLTDPVVVVEVLSPSTEARDRFDKRLLYQRLSALREYMLVSQDAPAVDVYRRAADGWELEHCEGGDAVRLTALDLTMPLAELYRGLE